MKASKGKMLQSCKAMSVPCLVYKSKNSVVREKDKSRFRAGKILEV
jgi:hypothetical protein